MREPRWSLGVFAFLLASGGCEGEPVGVVECTSDQDCQARERCSGDHVCEKVVTGTGGTSSSGGSSTMGARGGTGGTGAVGAAGGEGGESGSGDSTGGSRGGAAGGGGRNANGGTGGALGGGAGSSGSGGVAGSGAAAGGGGDGATGGGPGGHCDQCTRTKIGNPIWEPTGAIIVAAAVGEYPEPIFSWLSEFLFPNHLRYEPENVFGPGSAAHGGPYDEEMFDLMLANGLVYRHAFSMVEYTPPSGIVLLFTVVPSEGAPEGLAAEFESGPIIPNDLFPLTLICDIYRGDNRVFSAAGSEYPGHNTLNTPVRKDARPVDGASHLVMACPSNDSYTRVGPGDFQYVVSIEDKREGKWLVYVPYTVH